MKKINYFFYLFIAISLFFTSCDNETELVTKEQEKVAIEPELTQDFDVDEQEVKNAINSLSTKNKKSYYHCAYNFLQPTNLQDEDVEKLACGNSKTMPILVSCNKTKVGEVKVSNDDENLYLTFSANKRWEMDMIFLNISAKNDIPFYSNGFPNLSKFNYRAYPYYYGGSEKAVYKIPLSKINLDTFEVVAYAKVYDTYYQRCYSSFAYDSNLTQKYYYSYYHGYYYGDWVRSFEYNKEDCNQYKYLEIFGRKFSNSNTKCIDIDINGKKLKGWSSWIPLRNILNSKSRIDLELFKTNNNCSIENTPYIGRFEILDYNTSSKDLTLAYYMYNYELGGENPRTTNKYKMITEIKFYIGPEEFPFDENGNYKPGISEVNFYSKSYSTPVQRTENITLNWNGNTSEDTKVYFIPYVKVREIEQ